MRSLICKAMAFFLAITLIIVGADWKILCYAEEEFTEVKINAVVNTIPQQLEVLQDQQGILYLSTDVLSEITVYQYDSETMKFVHDASDGSMNYREVWTFAEEGIQIVNFSRGMFSIQKEIAIPARPEYNGKRYLPLAELLPVLNANVLVEDGCLYVEDVEYSLTNILATLNIDEYLFDLYDDNDFLWFSDAEILSGWSYLFMTAVRFDWGRMAHIGGFDKFGPISTNTAQIEDYEEIFTSFLSEDTAYLQSVGEENEQYLPLVTYLSSDDYEEEQTRQSALSAVAEYSDRLHEKEIDKYPAMEYYGSQYELISSLDKMSTYVNNAIQLYSYAALYVDHVADHYQMLETVYASEWEHTLFEKLIEKDKSILASKNVYNRFNKNMVTSLSSYVIDQSWDKLLDEAMEYTLFTGPNIAATLIELGLNSYDSSLYETAKECQYLGYYNRLMERGYSRYMNLYHGGAGMSYDTLEDTRLSAIFTLLTSRASYQAMHVAALAMDDGKSLYEDEIAEIDCVLEKLYLAKYCCLTDSEEYIEEKISTLNGSIESIQISNVSNEELYSGFEKSFFSAMAKALNSCNSVFRYKVCDADCDGYNEMAFHASFSEDDSVRGTNVLFESINSPSVRYHLPTDSGSAWGGFIYDSLNERLMYSNQKASIGLTYSIYSIYENGSWKRVSEYISRFINENVEPEVESCYWEGVKVTEDEFRAKEKTLESSEWVDSNEIFNMYFDLPIQHLSDEFEMFLSKYCDVKESIQYTDSDGKKISIISVRNIFSEYLEDIDYFNNTSGYVVEQNEMRELMQSINTTCFVIDETELGTRIRSENFDHEISLSVVDGSIVVNNDTNLSLEYSAEEDTLETNFLKIISQNQTGAFNEVPIAELEQIAEELYLSNGHAVVSCYTYCDWEVDYDDTIPSEYEASYYRIQGCSSMQDVLEVIHQTFSSRYDDYNRGETSGDPREEGACAVTKCLSEERGLFKEVNGKVYVLCGNSPYYVSNASAIYQRTEDDEVWFTMSTDRPNRTFTADFSMVYEDGVWKMGAATYARY